MNSAAEQDSEWLDWMAASLMALNAAFGDAEPEYSLSTITEHNLDYTD